MQHYQDVLLDRSGNAIAGAIVTVVYNSTSLPADLYSDYAGTKPLTSIVTDADGSYSFYVSSGRYDYAFYKNGKLLKTETDVFIDQSTALQDLSTSAGASLVGFDPTGTVSASTVQTAINELDTEKASLAALAANTGASLIGFQQSGTGAVARTVDAKEKDNVSVWDFIPVGTNTATTDCTTYLQAAINSGAKEIRFGGDRYKITSPLIPVSNQSWVGVPGLTTLENGALTYLISTSTGSISTDLTNTLASNALKGSASVTLITGKGANFAVGDIALVQSEAAMPYSSITGKTGELWRIQTITGDVITFAGSLRYSYLTANTALIRKITPVENLSISDITLKCTDTVNYRRALTYFTYCLNLNLKNVRVEGSPAPGIQLAGCYDTIISNMNGYNMLSNDVTDFGYVVVELGANKGLNITSIFADRCRHAYTTSAWATLGYGTAMSSLISNGISINALRAGFDTHEDGDGITFQNCKTVGGAASGFQIRSVNTNLLDCSAIDVVGEGVFVVDSGVNTYISNITLRNTNTGSYGDPTPTSKIERGCIFSNAIGTIVDGAIIDNCGGPAIEGYTAYRAGQFSNLTISNVAQLASTNKFGMLFAPSVVSTVSINNASIINTDTLMTYGIKCDANATLINARNCSITGAQTSKSIYTLGTIESDGINTKSFGKSVSPLVISGGVLDVTNAVNSSIIVGGEGGAADVLDTITGGAEGDIIVLLRTSQAITITNNFGGGVSGGIQLSAGANKVMASASVIMLVKRSIYWVQPGY